VIATASPAWPPLPYESWRDTYATLHMWMQVAGKLSLALTKRTNHYWNIAFHYAPRGLTTPVMQVGDRTLRMTFDFVDHQLVIDTSDGAIDRIPLEPRSVADFYRLVMETLHRRGVDARIWTMPVEVPSPIRFEQDTVHASYDRAAAATFWRILTLMKPVFDGFRCGFVGKCSPVHFFWGSFDLAVTRFSGRRAPGRPNADAVTRESYSHEVISHGFWPGGDALPEPVFYAYAAPEPDGLRTALIEPAAASYNPTMSEFLLPYEAVRTAPSPADALMRFLVSTYVAAAERANWARADLERQVVAS